MRLSRSAWNNVIIFSVMGFILLINLTQKDEESTGVSETLSEQYVIGQNKVILTMSVDQKVTIERVGQWWQMMPALLPSQLLEQMMRAWQQAKGQIIQISIDKKQHSGLFVSMVLADTRQIQMYTVYLLEQQLIIHNHQTNQYLLLPEQMFNQLIPNGLLAN